MVLENIPPLDADGDREWRVNGEQHRDNGQPAVELANGGREWWINGRRHRDQGMPAMVHINGNQEWWINGIRQYTQVIQYCRLINCKLE